MNSVSPQLRREVELMRGAVHRAHARGDINAAQKAIYLEALHMCERMEAPASIRSPRSRQMWSMLERMKGSGSSTDCVRYKSAAELRTAMSRVRRELKLRTRSVTSKRFKDTFRA